MLDHKTRNETVDEEEMSSDDTVSIMKKGSEIGKIYKYIKITATILAGSLALTAAADKLYNIPKKVEDNSVTIRTHESRFQTVDKEFVDINYKISNNSSDITQAQRSIAEINLQQKSIALQNLEVAKTLSELNTSIKYFNENLKDLKQELKDMRENLNRKP